ncbi:type IV pilus assembly protein PilX [Povalibacter uvarum]|uniref:Type IV pilus assembly protein PilX n=1 Tax=Povalibacter uvarum TaxID=732238 RepID=A0A841HHF1_9GAMM|nr:PilX N-terminal domain-containing pilus assembly protein [Povalibacter uvarum]MBB6091839.1 type IV pilus assembly protein PilX [Povalibacter uvarum]
MRTAFSSQSKQQGAVLAVSMVVLLALTLFALGASQASRSHERMATGLQIRDVAFQTAEAALRAGERSLQAASAACAQQRCSIYARGALPPSPPYESADWWKRHGWRYTADDTEAPVMEAYFVVEEIDDVGDSLALSPGGIDATSTYYRVTAMARPDDSAPIVVQSTFAQRRE